MSLEKVTKWSTRCHNVTDKGQQMARFNGIKAVTVSKLEVKMEYTLSYVMKRAQAMQI